MSDFDTLKFMMFDELADWPAWGPVSDAWWTVFRHGFIWAGDGI